MKTIALNRVIENGMNPRDFDEGAQRRELTKLILSIQEHGLLMPPILYRKKGSKLYAPIDGHRRIRACRELGWQEIPYISSAERGLPEAMTDSEALKYILIAQGMSKPHKPKDTLELIGRAVDQNADGDLPEYIKDKAIVYKLSPEWIQKLLRNKARKPHSIGWTIMRDIYRWTLDERDVEKWVKKYLSGKIHNQQALERALRTHYGSTGI